MRRIRSYLLVFHQGIKSVQFHELMPIKHRMYAFPGLDDLLKVDLTERRSIIARQVVRA